MSDTSRTLGRTLWSLVLAALNATLILVALCLWLGWMVLAQARGISDGLNAAAAKADPVAVELTGLREEVAALRADLAALPEQGADSAALAALQDQAAQLDARFAATAETVKALSTDTLQLIDRAVDQAAQQIRTGLTACTAKGT